MPAAAAMSAANTVQAADAVSTSLGARSGTKRAIASKRKGSVKINAMKRTYQLHVPKNYDGTKEVPLVIVLHGALGSATISQWDTGMSKQSEKDGFIVAYPNGAYSMWNAGGCCGQAKKKNIDDVAFIRALIEKTKSEYKIDNDRVYVTGVSNGGMMAYRLAYELSDEIAAIAPVEGCMYPPSGMTASTSELATTKNFVSVIAFHGKSDIVIPYKGGKGFWFGYRWPVPSVSSALQYWVRQNHCNPVPQRETVGKKTIKETYSGGTNGTEVCLYTLESGGHAWPGGKRVGIIRPGSSRELSATETMCAFFWAHPKKRTSTGGS